MPAKSLPAPLSRKTSSEAPIKPKAKRMRPEEINGSRQRLIPPVDSNRGVAQSVNVSQGSKLPKAAFTKYRGPGAALDIDALFDGLQARKAEAATASDVEDKKKKKLKARRQAAEAEAAAAVRALEAEGARANRVKGSDSPIPLRFDATLGLPIYSMDQLKMGKGGGTAACPFDCECCF